MTLPLTFYLHVFNTLYFTGALFNTLSLMFCLIFNYLILLCDLSDSKMITIKELTTSCENSVDILNNEQ